MYNKSKHSLRVRLIRTSVLSMVGVVIISVIMFMNIRQMYGELNSIYLSNVQLNILQSSLKNVQLSVNEYLSSKNSDAMIEYFNNEQKLRDNLVPLNSEVINNENLIMQKNIKSQIETYLEYTNDCLAYKRARNINKYKETYEEASKLYKFLNNSIFNLNNSSFIENTNSYSDLLGALNLYQFISIIIIIMAGILDLILIILFTNRLTKPIEMLTNAAYQVAEGKFQIDEIEIYSNDEIGVVTEAFNNMLNKLHVNIERIKDAIKRENEHKEKELVMESHIKEAELKYLRAQINPHFMFNTLNAGAQLAMLEEADKTYEYIQNVADFYRYSISSNKDVISLRKEVELVDKYIFILNVRFGGEIKYKKDIEEEALNVEIPIMTLQPIIENCVNYGIRNINRAGKINLMIYKDGNRVCISISDNGIGISKEKIDSILNETYISESNDNSNGIGLMNVISRLKLCYNREDVIEIVSEGKDFGTEVAIYVPIEVVKNV